jgi:choice-of-anchor B domain-containing protein
MKKILTLLFAAAGLLVQGQVYDHYNIDLLGHISPDTVHPQSGNLYSGCWGWYQASKNKEYAISGGRNGTWFIDITNPTTPTVCAFVPGKSTNCTWRELKTYQHYVYLVSDVCDPNAFQILDMQYLPDSVRIVHSDTSLITRGHTIYIDNDKMYVASTYMNKTHGYSPMSVWSLADPEHPKIYSRIEQWDGNVAEVHDMFVNNDTIFMSAAWQGLRMYKLNADSSISPLGSFTNYHSGAYNHSSWLTDNGKHLVFCDEAPSELPIKMINVENMQNIQEENRWHPYPKTTPHNPFVVGNDHVVVSSYQDGLFIFNIGGAPDVSLVGFFDTYPQGGYNKGNYGTSAYAGNWGAYPFLPSKRLIASDMQNGIFILDASTAYQTVPVTSVKEQKQGRLVVYPNPAKENLSVEMEKAGNYNIKIVNLLGETVLVHKFNSAKTEIGISSIQAGSYLLSVEGASGKLTGKIIVAR